MLANVMQLQFELVNNN